MRHIDVGQARLAVEDSGGEGPVLIALHAGVTDSRAYDACTPSWVQAGWRVIRYDRRGFGRSTWQPEAFSHVDDLIAVMDALEVESAVLIGNSQGGKIALNTALAAPERVSGLVLVGAAISGAPYPFGTPMDPAEEALDEAAEAAEEAGDVELANALSAHLWLDGPLQQEGRVGGAARELFLDMNRIAMAAPSPGEEIPPAPAWPRLEEVQATTLVVICGFDETIANEWGREAARRIPAASLVEMPGSAHLPMLDDPDGFLAALVPITGSAR